jgi:hypothetical protein
MRLTFVLVFGLALFVNAFDPLEYIKKEHDKVFFGLGGGACAGLNNEYTLQFPEVSFLRVILEAGLGDYPFIADIRYCVDWGFGNSHEMVSGTGAKLTAYQIIPALRTYLFWKHPRLKTYVLSGIIGEQENLISTTSAGKDVYQATAGLRYGFLMALGFDIVPSEYSFIDLEIGYAYARSDLFEKKERWVVNAVFNLGR